MPRKIAAAVVVMLLGLAAPPSRATDVNYLEISLLGYDAGLYGVALDVGREGATTCTLQTPTDSAGSDCYLGMTEVVRWDLDWNGLQAEIGTEGDDWTLILDEGLGTETTVYIDFGTVSQSDWFSLPMITNPPDGASGVSPDTSIDWDWPAEPDVGGVSANLYFGDLMALMPGPVVFDCESDDLPGPLPTTWDPGPGCLSPGTWTAVVLNENEYLRAVPVGLNIVGNWTLENDEWLSAGSLDTSLFTVVPEPSTALLFGFGLVGLVVSGRRSAL